MHIHIFRYWFDVVIPGDNIKRFWYRCIDTDATMHYDVKAEAM